MKYIGLNNRSYSINTSQYLNRPKNKSKLHLQVREFLQSHFKMQALLEEVGISGFPKGKTLYLDFFLPNLSIVCEANGLQHSEHISHFHPTKADFLLAKHNDRLKKEWAELNNLTLIVFSYNETQNEWINKLQGIFLEPNPSGC